MDTKIALKDELFNREKVEQISLQIENVFSTFNTTSFIDDVIVKFPQLELKERIYYIRDSLKSYLPDDYQEAVTILLQSLPPELDPNKKDDDFGDFIYAPYSEFVTSFGCCDEHLDFSLNALREITKRFSVELAIRDFINHYPNETLQMLEACAGSSNYHERRLASECLRPKLPWAKKITLQYDRPIALLDKLYHDSTRYVTRSVANHINDLSKIDAPLVIETLKRWQEEGRQVSKEMAFITNHALRTLVKKGDEDALALLGYPKNVALDVSDFRVIDDKVNIGDALAFSFSIEAKEDVNLIVDYVIHFKTKNGTYSPKVHKVKKLTLKKGESLHLEKIHPFKANMTTRKLYEGEHKLALQINGVIYQTLDFMLKH